MKVVGGVDFTKYAILPIVNKVSGQKLVKVKNAVNLSKVFFSANDFFMHICNMSVTYLQNIKRVY